MSDGELALELRNIRHAAPSIARVPMQASASDLRQLAKQDAESAKRARIALSQSLALLRNPIPDTFLGRRTQLHFRKLEDD